MYADHSTLKYLVKKQVLGGNICRWVILFLEFDFEIVKPSRLNSRPDHLLRIEIADEPVNLDDSIPDEELFVITMFDDHYKDIIQFFSTGYAPAEFTTAQKK